MAKALGMSQKFFNEVALPSLKANFPTAWKRMAAGLVGNGSECFGFDDELSQDHDWGVEFFVWLTDTDFETIGADVREWKTQLFANNPEQPYRNQSNYGVRDTVLSSSMFYSQLIGCAKGPQTIMEWRRAPEANLAMCVNGRVFIDSLGEFTQTREYIAGYYPEDLRRKKIAARCMSIAQTGQYNFLRIAQRGDIVAQEITLSKFVQDVISMVFMLNKHFSPYYKWANRAMCDLPVLASEVAPLLLALYTNQQIDGQLDPGNILLKPISQTDHNRAIIIEKICALIAEEVQGTIANATLAQLPTQYE